MIARNLAVRLEKLEKGTGGGDDASAFYILWINPGEDRVAALKAAKAAGKIPAGVAAYCAEWKAPGDYMRQGRTLGPRARSRLTDCQRISDDEKNILWDAIGDDAEVRALATGPHDKMDVRSNNLMSEMTDRDLIGALICGCGGEPGIGHDEAP